MIPLFVYQGSAHGEQPGTLANYWGQDWIVLTNGSLVTEVPGDTALELIVNHNPIQLGIATSPEQQAEMDAFSAKLYRRRRIDYLQQYIAAYNNELNTLITEKTTRTDEINQLITQAQIELNELLDS